MSSTGGDALRPTDESVPTARLSPVQWLATDSLLAAVCLVVVVMNQTARGVSSSAAWWQFGLLVVATAPLPLRRFHPVGTFAMIAGSVAILCLAGRTPYILDATAAVAAYSVAARLTRRRALLVLFVGEIALGAATAVAIAMHTADGYFIHTMLAVGALGFAGDGARSRRQFARAAVDRGRLQRAEEWERYRSTVRAERLAIARDLHDIVAHSLTVMTVQAGVGARTAGANPDLAVATLTSIQSVGRSARDELRVVLNVLRDDEAEQTGTAPTPGLDDLDRLLVQMQETGLAVELTRVGDEPVSAVIQLTIYRIAQEALTNVVKHAGGDRATIDLAVDATTIRLEVRNGPRERSSPARPTAGHGLIGMRERVAAFRGTLLAEATDEGGFRVVAILPRETR